MDAYPLIYTATDHPSMTPTTLLIVANPPNKQGDENVTIPIKTLASPLNTRIRRIVFIKMRIRRLGPDIFPASVPLISLFSPLPLKISPPLHRNLGTVELALIHKTSLLRLLVGSFTSFSPRKVVEFPEGIGWQNEVPDGE